MSDKGSIHFTGLGHQFKAKARTYQAIANDLRDVMREHESFEFYNDKIMTDLYSDLRKWADVLKDAAGRELDSFNDRD